MKQPNYQHKDGKCNGDCSKFDCTTGPSYISYCNVTGMVVSEGDICGPRLTSLSGNPPSAKDDPSNDVEHCLREAVSSSNHMDHVGWLVRAIRLVNTHVPPPTDSFVLSSADICPKCGMLHYAQIEGNDRFGCSCSQAWRPLRRWREHIAR